MQQHNKPIPLEEMEKLAQCGATQADMAGYFGVSIRTIVRRLAEPEFESVYECGKAKLCISLRQKQVQMALSGNGTMLVWLGKQLLGQKDKVEHSGSGPGGAIVYSSARELLARRIAGITERNRKGGSS